MTLRPTIALGSIFIECNQFGGRPAELSNFEQYLLLRGEEMLRQREGVVGGMLAQLGEQSAQVAPLLEASSCPAGPVMVDCYRTLKQELLRRLSASQPVDGVLLALHGSGVVAPDVDLEADLLAAVRRAVGSSVPIVATLDLHAHVSREMVEAADALIAWETYPHRDALSTGRRGAEMLLGILAGRWRPTMALAKMPVLTSGCLGHTDGEGPFADLMRFAKSHEIRSGVLSTNVLLVHPYLDLPDMGSGGLVITDNDMPRAVALAEQIADRYWQRRHDLEPQVFTPGEAIRRGLEIDGGPVLLVETADCAGGGAAGDSVATITALLQTAPNQPSLAIVVDPAAAQLCHRAGVDAKLILQLGHRLDPQYGEPIEITGRVVQIGDGAFSYTGGIWKDTLASMGPSAVFRCGAINILIASRATYDWADEQYRSMELHAAEAKFVVVKNPMNYRSGYRNVAKADFLLDTPGPTPATLRGVAHRNVKRPYFPADAEISGLRPILWRGRSSTSRDMGPGI